jgi:hypothetical protein
MVMNVGLNMHECSTTSREVFFKTEGSAQLWTSWKSFGAGPGARLDADIITLQK